MEVVSLGVLVALWERNEQLCVDALMSLQPSTIDYIRQIANEHDPRFGSALGGAISNTFPSGGGVQVRRSPQGSPRTASNRHSNNNQMEVDEESQPIDQRARGSIQSAASV